MTHFSARADQIPGLLTASWVFKGTTMDAQKISLVWMDDNGQKELIEVDEGLEQATQSPNLTPKMQSYLSGLAEVGVYLSMRETVDEDDVTEDDIEMAAILLAFPRVAKNEDACAMIKKHLDMLQEQGLLTKTEFGPNSQSTADAPEEQKEEPVAEEKAAADVDSTKDDTKNTDEKTEDAKEEAAAAEGADTEAPKEAPLTVISDEQKKTDETAEADNKPSVDEKPVASGSEEQPADDAKKKEQETTETQSTWKAASQKIWG